MATAAVVAWRVGGSVSECRGGRRGGDAFRTLSSHALPTPLPPLTGRLRGDRLASRAGAGRLKKDVSVRCVEEAIAMF